MAYRKLHKNYIHHMKHKVIILCELLIEAGKIPRNSSNSVTTLARYCDIPESTLQSAVENSRLSVDKTTKLAKKCEFDSEHPSWIDKNIPPIDRLHPPENYLGRDKPELFRNYVRAHWGLESTYLTLKTSSAPSIHTIAQSRMSISTTNQATVNGAPFPLHLTIDIDEIFHETGFAYGFKELRILLKSLSDKIFTVLEPYGQNTECESYGDARLVNRCTKHDAQWDLKSDQNVLNGHYDTIENLLCLLSGVEINDRFNGQLNFQHRGTSLRRSDGAQLNDSAKKEIIKILIESELNLGRPNSTGWVTLVSQDFQILGTEQK